MVCTILGFNPTNAFKWRGDLSALYSETLVFLYIAMVAVTLAVINAFLQVTMYFVGVRL